MKLKVLRDTLVASMLFASATLVIADEGLLHTAQLSPKSPPWFAVSGILSKGDLLSVKVVLAVYQAGNREEALGKAVAGFTRQYPEYSYHPETTVISEVPWEAGPCERKGQSGFVGLHLHSFLEGHNEYGRASW